MLKLDGGNDVKCYNRYEQLSEFNYDEDEDGKVV